MFIPRTLAETEGGGGRGPWARALIVGALLAASLWAIMSVNVASGQVSLGVGDVAQTEIRAPISSSFVSESQTNAAREEAADQVATVYVPIAPLADIADQQLRAYDALVGGITRTLEQRDAGDLTDEELPDELNRIAPQLTDEQVTRLSAISLIGWQRISDAGREVLEAVQSEEIRADEITDAREQLRNNITQDLFQVDRELAGDLAEDLVAANYEASDEQTEAARQAARNAVGDVIVSVEQGETIVRAGDRITQLHLETLDELGLTRPRLEASTIGGNALIALILATLLVGFLWRFEPQIWFRNRSLLLFGLALLGSVVAVKVAADRALWAYVVPTGATVLLATILLNGAAGAAMAVALAVMAGVMNGVALEPAVYTLAGGAAAMIAMVRAERLNAFVRAGLLLAVTNIAVLTAFGLLDQRDVAGILQGIAAASVNAALAVVLAVGSFAVIGSLFGIMTVFQLLELANPSSRLLRRLLLETPGTYHHSVMVGQPGRACGGDHRRRSAAGPRGGLLPRHRQDEEPAGLHREPGGRPQHPRRPVGRGQRPDHQRAHQATASTSATRTACRCRSSASSRSTTAPA